jgi:DNA topoisomerase IB
VFCFEGKSGVEHEIRVIDPEVCAALDALAGRRRSDARLLSHRAAGRWVATRAEEINLHVGTLFRAEVTAKDFRTWHGTVEVAAALGSVERADSARERRRQVRAAIDSAAALLGNTPTVARNSYVDPRVLDCFEEGRTIRATILRLPSDPAAVQDRLDRAVARLLTGEGR